MSDSIEYAWTIGEGARRVECHRGHAQVIGLADDLECDDLVDDEPCGAEQVVLAVGPYRYDPNDPAHRAAMEEALTWP